MNRSVFALQLLAAAAIGTAALGQVTAPPAGAPAQAAPAAAPAAPAPPAPAPPPPPPPVLPTTGDGAAIIAVLNKICLPLNNGAVFEPPDEGERLQAGQQERGIPAADGPEALHAQHAAAQPQQ